MAVKRQALLLLSVLVAGCGSSTATGSFADVVRAGHPREVTVTGTVQQVLPDGHGPRGPHERFVLLADGVQVEIDHNLALAERAPLQVGDTVTVHGQFEPDPGHPIIHYTHHATGQHEGGYIQLRNRSYAIGESSTGETAPAARGRRGKPTHDGPLRKRTEDI
jgi:hypothetical protein